LGKWIGDLRLEIWRRWRFGIRKAGRREVGEGIRGANVEGLRA
jgi:hypothetical protein